ncbi:Porin-like protein H precursor [Vibrio aerogenes CECT 7868]|uniref:Porin-like protein H n=1 Tax=Vibrio aerogenes CECT 7868 TaxID=1216006 RepID=A0A1M5X946_9VIBR|nr:porin [Vibrio aerogenes]SHH95723.1 Porin-like protein H precursor [Vibrio aerogenes CECT 7868]
MKKTLVALAVLAAGSAQAAEVYNNDGVSVSISGSAEVQYIQDFEQDGTNVDATTRLDDGDVTITTSIEMTDDWATVAGLSYDLATDDRDAETDKLYVGFESSEYGTITFGRQTLIADDDGIGKDFELGDLQYFGTQIESADDVVKYVYDNGQFYFGLSHDLDAANGDSTSGVEVLDGRIGVRFDDFDVRLYVYTDDYASGFETTAYNLEAEYTFDAFNIAASYGEAEIETSSGATFFDATYIELNGSYTVDKFTYAIGYAFVSEDETDTDGDNIYANVVYQLHANVRTYAEIGYKDIDNTADYDLGYLVGMEVKF